MSLFIDPLNQLQAILAGWVLTMDGPPIRCGGVAWRGGRIAAVGPREDIQRLHPRVIADRDDAILMPGLINSHAHLELTGMAGKFPPGLPFTAWLTRLMKQRKRLTDEKIARDIRRGEQRLLANGVTAVADISSFPAARSTPRFLRSRIFHEVVGLRRTVSIPRKKWLSPHAPYSLTESNLRRLALWWDRHPGAVLSMHMAESPMEDQYFLTGVGEFRTFFQAHGLPLRATPHSRVIPYLDRLRLLRPGMIAVHANEVNAADARILARRGVAVAVCPGSLSYFRFSKFGVRNLLDAGVTILWGTDSMASNSDLNLFRDMRTAARWWKLSPRALLESATRLPGERLWSGRTGTLKRGNEADMILIRRIRKSGDPHRDLFTGNAERRILARVLNGVPDKAQYSMLNVQVSSFKT